ncbi:MAG: hypothetical protein WBA23_19500 [Tunicatimonas sp.]|uniref:hypothetical protein n=1 Tax=Tunicatimonas sp. TaxID=1940096 RepID=UPI003C75148D
MMKKVRYLWMILLLSFGCPVYDPSTGILEVINKSDTVWYIYDTCEGYLDVDRALQYKTNWNVQAYDETGKEVKFEKHPNYKLDIRDTAELSGFGSPSSRRIFCKEDTLTLFLIPETVMRENEWRIITKNRMYKRRIHLTQGILDSLNWKVTIR